MEADYPSPAPLSADALVKLGLQPGEPVRFDRFVASALYHPELGYYRRNRLRIGRERGSDFYTSTALGTLFGELVCAACATLLPYEDLKTYTFVEVGAEPAGGVLRDVAHPFGTVRTIGVNEALHLGARCVVFSNELFDAQPFRRFVASSGTWLETYVVNDGAQLREELRPIDSSLFESQVGQTGPGEPPATDACRTCSPVGAALPANNAGATDGSADRFDGLAVPRSSRKTPRPTFTLPSDAPEGYRIDAPLAARDLAHTIAALPWNGLFLAFDYGKSWRELIEATPQGTARAYARHRQSNDLLAAPGDQDLTCHVCWDWIVDALRVQNFHDVALESQEAFLVKRADTFIAAILAADAGRFSARKQALMHLIHPGNMGHKFQALSARRL